METEVRPIDIHVHDGTEKWFELLGERIEYVYKYFRLEKKVRSVEESIEEFEKAGVDKVVLLPIDASFALGRKISNDYTYNEWVNKYPDKCVSFCSVDPHLGKAAVMELERTIKEYGFKGLKFAQNIQDFYPHDKMVYPLYEKCVELDIPVMFHTGITGLPGARLDQLRPIWVDHVATDFPDLKIIAAHWGWPWYLELIAIAIHKPNVYIDLSGWAPEYLAPELIQYANTMLGDRILFGTDFPALLPGRWMKGYKESLESKLRPGIGERILGENARKLLKL